ncbi:hypothetical protein J31TS4_04800 [Paenibacillus sp. J31TS4]|uniref:glycoside hydrolase domain-containing protein n=1 Tax=Paenibacillus sp. J31TS4 TaxID=2807195 RepID=UPI001B123CDB|nr:glycoside hydrolase domain-containing protein [Paenibacillus sp. J31TS4]GIP37200.1 hypothetical protein J31TS4_04800 [Paenibacillus sp. J31TS4]
MTNPVSLQTRTLSSLSKVFADEDLKDSTYPRASVLRNERFHFQVAYRSDRLLKKVKVEIESALADVIRVRNVGLAPSEMPVYADHDADVLRSTPGLYPDPLFSITEREGLTAVPHQWRSVWITVELSGEQAPEVYPIRVRFVQEDGTRLAEESFELEVLQAELPEQKLLYTNWFHADCLANYYGEEVFSEAHWEQMRAYLQTAADNGMNMVLTPLFTPPLDTAVGGERRTVQLVDVKRDGDRYTFGFDRLQRWIDMCEEAGIRNFECSHLFTQWGAKHAPKIIATVDGEEKKLFGWETDAHGEEYRTFLDQFLPELVDYLKEAGIASRCWFHVSDEPHADHLETYRSASDILSKHLNDFPVIDALSSYKFYETGSVRRPIPASNHIEPFLENNVPELWTYYCCSQYKEVANRFFCMPSSRNRILGMQLYKFQIAGFLHWGYNFWNAQYSTRAIDPYRVTDAGYGFPSGDAFVVYPGEDGRPVESLRLAVFYDALQDLRALELLESRIGRERVLQLLEEELDQPITFREYPRSMEWLLRKREQINRLIGEPTGALA